MLIRRYRNRSWKRRWRPRVRRSTFRAMASQETDRTTDQPNRERGAVRSLSVFVLGMKDYKLALDLQEAGVAARIRDEICDMLILLVHPQVYTLGRGADAGYIRNAGVAS